MTSTGDLFGWNTCEFSPDPQRRWRYVLRHRWSLDGDIPLIVMVNPSTADELTLDPTLTRCAGFMRDLGFGGMVIANLFAYRTPYPAVLRRAAKAGVDVVGADNDMWLERLALEHMVRIAAWGNNGVFQGRAAAVLGSGVLGDVWCWGTNDNGTPKHPLMIPYSSTLRLL